MEAPERSATPTPRRRRTDDFPTTRCSVLVGLKSLDRTEKSRSLERLTKAYWKPIYKYVRMRWHKTPADAEEVTQAFFLRTLDKDTFIGYDAEKARFRTFVRVCVDRFVFDAERRESARKRGGGTLRFDFQLAEDELRGALPTAATPEELFEIEWARSIFESAVESLRATCEKKKKLVHFRAFELFHLGDDETRISYAEAAKTLGISVSDVTNRLSYARREFRAIVLDALRDLTGSEQEWREEARALLGLEL